MIKKGIVLEINKDKVVVLTPDGEFLQLKKREFIPILGEEYESSVYHKSSFIKPLAIAACLLLFINIGIIYRAYFQVYNTVYVSINPSIKLYVNRKNHILKTEAMNKDGETLLSNIHSIKGENCEKGIIDIIECAINMKYLNSNNPKVEIHSEKENTINYTTINKILKQTDSSPSQTVHKNSQKDFQKNNVIVENTMKNPTVQKDKIPVINKPSVNIAPKTNNAPSKLKPSPPLKNNVQQNDIDDVDDDEHKDENKNYDDDNDKKLDKDNASHHRKVENKDQDHDKPSNDKNIKPSKASKNKD